MSIASCFCGCGRTVPITRVRTNRLGVRHDQALDGMRTLVDRGKELRADPEATVISNSDADEAIEANTAFVEQGESLRARIQSHVHRVERVERAVLKAVRSWQREALAISRGGGRA